MGLSPALDDVLRPLKQFHIYDLQVGQNLGRFALAVAQDTDVERIFDNAVNAGGGDFPAFSVVKALLCQIAADTLGAVALINILLENQLDNFGLVRVYSKVTDRLVPLVLPALIFQPVAVGDLAASVVALLRQLTDTGLDTDRGFDALPGRLPVADIVQQFVNVSIKPLLALLGAPYLDAVLHKPLHHKGRLVIFAAQAVKHEHKQDVKCALQGQLLDFLHSVPVFGRNLEARNPFFGKLPDDLPSGLTLGKLPAILFLHGNIVLFYLSHSGNSV